MYIYNYSLNSLGGGHDVTVFDHRYEPSGILDDKNKTSDKLDTSVLVQAPAWFC